MPWRAFGDSDKAKPWKGQVPFHPTNGNPIDATFYGGQYDWRDNDTFTATMTIIGYSRGRSSTKIELEDSTGIVYTMFLVDLLYMLTSTVIMSGKVAGTWAFVKRGTDYGLTWLGEDYDED